MKVLDLILILAVAVEVNSKIAPCAAGKGSLPKSITVLDCNDSEDCEFVRGRALLADFEFVAQSQVTSLNPSIYMTLGKNRERKGLTNLPEDRLFACEWLIAEYLCPIVKGNTVVWRLNLPISPFEEINDAATIEIQMRSHDNTTQFCAQIWGHTTPV